MSFSKDVEKLAAWSSSESSAKQSSIHMFESLGGKSSTSSPSIRQILHRAMSSDQLPNLEWFVRHVTNEKQMKDLFGNEGSSELAALLNKAVTERSGNGSDPVLAARLLTAMTSYTDPAELSSFRRFSRLNRLNVMWLEYELIEFEVNYVANPMEVLTNKMPELRRLLASYSTFPNCVFEHS